MPLLKVVQSEIDETSVTKLAEKKEARVKDVGKLYTPHIFAEYEIMEEKLGAGTNTHRIQKFGSPREKSSNI